MEALFYEKREDRKVKCGLCHHRCLINDNGFGRCKVRQNVNGVLETMIYSRLVAINPDPIEKKPLYHVMPGSLAYSIGAAGCNFRCLFCQNSEISQMPLERGKMGDHIFSAADIVDDAERSNCRSIAYTYTEPTVNFEFCYDTAVLARGKGLKNIFVTNGYMSPEAIDMIAPFLDAANVDLKSFSNDFYRDMCGARLEPVKENLKHLRRKGVFVEVTTLVIPGRNDDEAELTALAEFLVKELGPETPWHISRFHPTYKLLDVSPTPVGTLTRARDIGLKVGLKFVYIGNVHGHPGENTYCPQCAKVIIERAGFYNIKQYKIEGGHCLYCGALINGIEM
ncbi:MAG: AmmeMemoRadiSam system radical SAM enzyme [Thermodesulfobacteriota bacterium]